MSASELSTVDLKLAVFRNEVVAAYAESRGVDLAPAVACCTRCRYEIRAEDTPETFNGCEAECPLRTS